MERSPQSGRLAPPATSPWLLLPRDLLGEISGHLHEAADFVRFNAICRPWRKAALLSPAASAAHPRFLPWLAVLCNDRFLHVTITYGSCTSSGKTPSNRYYCDGLAMPHASSSSTGDGDNNYLVVSAQGTAAWFFTAHDPEPTMVDLLTGAAKPFPRFPVDDDEMSRWMTTTASRGIVYGDGTVFMYSFVSPRRGFGYASTFTAAILRTGDGTHTAAWKPVKENSVWTTRSHLSFAYHDGKILACDELRFSLLNLDDDSEGWINWRPDEQDPRVDEKYKQYSYHVFESRGELIRATVRMEKAYLRRGCPGDDPTRALSVVVHSMADGHANMRWDGQSLIDRVLFLASPVSFTADAAQLGVPGGCAYFVYGSRVFKYSLIDREAQLMERMRPWCASGIWLQPRPAISKLHKVQETLLDVKNKN